MSDNPLSPEDIENLRATLKDAKEQLDGLFNYERAGIDVSKQREKLNEVITKTTKILDVWGD